jgi:hypothetical protein
VLVNVHELARQLADRLVSLEEERDQLREALREAQAELSASIGAPTGPNDWLECRRLREILAAHHIDPYTGTHINDVVDL